MIDESDSERPQAYWRIPSIFNDLGDDVGRHLGLFFREILRFNSRLNLISKKTELEADLLHFADSILGSRIVLKNTDARVIYDIGSGSGLPGIVMAILAPEREIACLDVDERKIEFQKLVVSQLGIKNCRPIRARFEDIAAGSVRCAVTRGPINVSKTLLLARKSVAVGGDVFHFKGRNWVREVAEIPSQLCAFWAPRLVEEYDIPIIQSRMAVVVTKRIG